MQWFGARLNLNFFDNGGWCTPIALRWPRVAYPCGLCKGGTFFGGRRSLTALRQLAVAYPLRLLQRVGAASSLFLFSHASLLRKLKTYN